MTDRKPSGMAFETWVDRQIRQAEEKGEFDVPGKGKPLNLTGEYDELWWVKQLLEREQLNVLPPGLSLRKAAEDIRENLESVRTEAALRELVEDHNERVLAFIRRPQDGAAVIVMPMNVDALVREWRERRGARTPAGSPPPATPVASTNTGRRSALVAWLSRLGSWRRRPRAPR